MTGLASFVEPAYGPRYLALPDGHGVTVRICGPAGCVVRTSTDAGPDRAMQRARRVADLSFVDFRHLCGCDPWSVGLLRVTVTAIPSPPSPSVGSHPARVACPVGGQCPSTGETPATGYGAVSKAAPLSGWATFG